MVVMATQSQFAEWLSEMMSKRKVNQSALATYLGTSPSTVNAWLNRGATPGRKLTQKLAEYFRVNVDKVEMYINAKPGDVILRPAEAQLAIGGPPVIPEVIERLQAMSPEEQRKFALPAIELAERFLREEKEPGQA